MRKLILTCVAALCVAASVLVAPLPAFAQSLPFPASTYLAANYGNWVIQSQQANTYQFSPVSYCTVPQTSGGLFNPFATTAPVYIADSTAASSEVVTPSSIISGSAFCGVVISAVNQHTSFSLRSGTGGLQEALNALTSATLVYPPVIILDRNWYTLAGAVPGTSPAAMIAAATVVAGSNVIVVDQTTAPFTVYTVSGTKLASNGASAPFFNTRVSSYTVLTVPTALSTAAASAGLITTATTGGTIPASSTYRLAATYVDASGGETLISIDTASTATIATGSGTATNTLTVTSPAALAGAVGWRLYVSAAAGAAASEILYTPVCTASTTQSLLGSVCAIGATATVTAIVTGTATIPVVSTAYPRAGGASLGLPPFTALGTVAAAATGTLATINIPAGYFNVLGKQLTICGNGNATTNATPGTLTLAQTFASIAGVTSITPWTVVSGTTTASAVVPFNFCETITTAATGATGTLEVHGCVNYGLAGTAPATGACDFVVAVSSTVDLTKQDQIAFTIKPTTTALTAAQLRQSTFQPAN